MQPKMAFNAILDIPSTQLNTTTVSRQLIIWCYEDAVFPCWSIMIADWLSQQLVKISGHAQTVCMVKRPRAVSIDRTVTMINWQLRSWTDSYDHTPTVTIMVPCLFLAVTIIAAEQLQSFCRKIRRRYHWYYKVIGCFPWSRTKKNYISILSAYYVCLHGMQVSQSGPARTHHRRRPPSCMIVTAKIVTVSPQWNLSFNPSGVWISTWARTKMRSSCIACRSTCVLAPEATRWELDIGDSAADSAHPSTDNRCWELGSAWGTPARTPRWSWVCSHRWSSSSLRPFHCTPASPRQRCGARCPQTHDSRDSETSNNGTGTLW